MANFPFALDFTCGDVYVTLSIWPALSFPCCVPSLFSMSAYLFLTCKYVHHFSRLHRYVLIYDICFSLWLTSLCITGSRFIHLMRTDSNLFLFTALYKWSNTPFLYIYHNFFIPLLGIYLEKTIIEKDTCTPRFTAALFTTARTRKQCRFPSTDEWIISRLIKAPNRISKKKDLSLQDCKQKI